MSISTSLRASIDDVDARRGHARTCPICHGDLSMQDAVEYGGHWMHPECRQRAAELDLAEREREHAATAATVPEITAHLLRSGMVRIRFGDELHIRAEVMVPARLVQEWCDSLCDAVSDALNRR